MAFFIVERSVPGTTLRDLEIAACALEESCRRVAHGRVRHVHTLMVIGGSKCISLFEAETSDLVRQVNEIAQFHYNRIEEAIQVPSPCE